MVFKGAVMLRGMAWRSGDGFVDATGSMKVGFGFKGTGRRFRGEFRSGWLALTGTVWTKDAGKEAGGSEIGVRVSSGGKDVVGSNKVGKIEGV